MSGHTLHRRDGAVGIGEFGVDGGAVAGAGRDGRFFPAGRASASGLTRIPAALLQTARRL